MRNYNRRNKIANTFFDVIKYILTVIVIGNVFGQFDWQQVLIGLILSACLGIIAYFIAPEKEE